MKKIILLVCILVVPSALPASGDFSLWGGYSYSFMENANSALSASYNMMSAQVSKTQLNGGITAGLDGAYWYYAWWGIGGRISYTGLFDAGLKGSEAGFPVTITMAGSLFQACAGVPLLFEFFNGKMSVGGGIYAGWGLASVSIDKAGGVFGGAIKADGACFVLDVPVRLTYHLSSSYLLDLNISWKNAYVRDLFVSDDTIYSLIPYNKGSKMTYPYGTPYSMNFSGLMIGLGFNWRFSSKDWPWYNKKFSLSE